MSENHKDAKAQLKAAKAYKKATRPWSKKKRFILLGLIALIAVVSQLGGGKDDNKTPATNTAVTPAAQAAAEKTQAAVPAATQTPEKKSDLNAKQEVARVAAEQYLQTMPFSKAGLIEQLSSDAGSKFPKEDAIAAVNSLNVDWKQQAAKAAQQYLDTMPMSCDALINQLASEAGSKFTQEQATYGAKQTKVC